MTDFLKKLVPYIIVSIIMAGLGVLGGYNYCKYNTEKQATLRNKEIQDTIKMYQDTINILNKKLADSAMANIKTKANIEAMRSQFTNELARIKSLPADQNHAENKKILYDSTAVHGVEKYCYDSSEDRNMHVKLAEGEECSKELDSTKRLYNRSESMYELSEQKNEMMQNTIDLKERQLSELEQPVPVPFMTWNGVNLKLKYGCALDNFNYKNGKLSPGIRTGLQFLNRVDADIGMESNEGSGRVYIEAGYRIFK